MFTVDSALQHTCAGLREHAARGEITGPECDLLIDGAILLAVHLEALIQDGYAGGPPGMSVMMRAGAGQRAGECGRSSLRRSADH